MATNRYTRLTPSTFTPMSLEEMMMVPLAKQKQHEDILNNQDAIEAELSNMKRLSQDDPFVTEKIKSYKDQLEGISNSISKEGVNRETSRNFRKLFNNYKFDISDSGDLGRAQNNYNLAKQREAEFRKNIDRRHSQTAISKLIDKGYKNFQGTLREDGSYNEFGNFGGPGFYDYRKEAVDILSRAAADGISVGNSGSDIEFITDPSTGATMAQVTNSQLTEQEKENADQIAAAFNSMMTSYSYGDRKEFANLYDLTPDRLRKEFGEMAEAFKFNQKATNRQNKTSVQVVGKQGSGKRSSTTTSPKGDTWESIPVHARSGRQGGSPLGNRLLSDDNLTFRNSMVGFRKGVIKDFRADMTPEELAKLPKGLRKQGAWGKGYGKHEIDGEELEKIFLDPNFVLDPTIKEVKDGARGAGIFKDGNNLVINENITGDALHIEGHYNGQDYTLSVKDPNVVRAFRKYGTTKQGKQKYRELIKERRKNSNSLRAVDPFLQMRKEDGSWEFSDKQILQAYTDAMESRVDYFQDGYKPKNIQNSYYSQTKDLFGEGNNIGTIATRKVRMFTEDGTEIADFKGQKGIDKISNLLMGNEYDYLNEDERKSFHEQLRNSTDYGLTIGDHEFVNPMRRSVTTPDGDTVFFMIDNNNELSGKNKEFPGIDDSSELQRYLIEGKPFVRKPSQNIQTRTGETIQVDQWFIHVPKIQPDGRLEITPLVVYGQGDFNNLEEISQAIDFETLQPKEGYKLKVETQQEVDARIKTNLNRYYDKVANQKTTQSRSDKL